MPRAVEDIQYELYADVLRIEWKKGMIRLGFGRWIGRKPVVYCWVYFTLSDLKSLNKLISDNLKTIDKAQRHK